MSIRDYYDKVTSVDIGEVAEALLGERIKYQTGDTWECDCPNHQSASGTSLKICLQKQAFHCFGCSKGGDVLHLVEFIQSGTVTKGEKGVMSDSHKKARDYLAKMAGLSSLTAFGRTADEWDVVHRERQAFEDVCQLRNKVVDYYHSRLLARPDVLEWLFKNYAISLDTIKKQMIGFTESRRGGKLDGVSLFTDRHSHTDLLRTGFFHQTKDNGLFPLFQDRLFFPYWSRGNVVFGIGRKTPWTPDNKWETGKYKKMLVHDPKKRPYIAKSVCNSMLFNEDVLTTDTKTVVITEGITDAVALMERNIPVISPVTVRFKKDDWKRVIPKLKKLETVYVCLDNEISNIGLQSALDMGDMLMEADIDCKVVTLTLGQTQKKARETLLQTYGISPLKSTKEIDAILEALPEDSGKNARRLMSQAKTDINEWFRQGNTGDQFRRLLSAARGPLHMQVDQLVLPECGFDQARVLKPLFVRLAVLSTIVQDDLFQYIKEKHGLNIKQQRAFLAEVKRENKTEIRKKKVRAHAFAKPVDTSSLAGVLKTHLIEMRLMKDTDYGRLGEVAFNWLKAEGARFFKTADGEPFFVYKKKIFWMDSASHSMRRKFLADMYMETRIEGSCGQGRKFYNILKYLAIQNAIQREHFNWIYSDTARNIVYFNLNNDANEILRIGPNGIQVWFNGDNEEDVVLTSNRKMKPIQFDPNADLDKAGKIMQELLVDNLTCSNFDKVTLITWLSCFLLIDFANIKPLMRCEGSAGSGKTSAMKLVSTLLFGSYEQKQSTLAANYSDGSQNPLMILDNIEVKNLSEGLKDFLICAATGVVKEKRKNGTDMEVIKERVKCLIALTGIEPMGADLEEIMGRTFLIQFDRQFQQVAYLETQVMAGLSHHRDLLLSAMIIQTQKVLKWIQDGYQEKVMALFQNTIGKHQQSRANDFLALMYLTSLAPLNTEKPAIDEHLEGFIPVINRLNQVSEERELLGNQFIGALEGAFHAYNTALELDKSNPSTRSHVATFREKYGLTFKSEVHLSNDAASLFRGLGRLCRDFGLPFNYKSTVQLGSRINKRIEFFERAGFKIETSKKSGNKTNYDIVQKFA